ncbi:hypothetical protein BDB01DRAFT_332914 [Pilobolus umbonatus]|nr:hypothetical protein BDB01DRAFT_332914 [Pilobolus umbonatus]
MTRCLCFGNTNHAQLIKNCYPLKEGGILPLASQLSYLTFYASSRPAKLSKVGAYMDKKVTKDIRKGRKDNSHVSLLIIQKLIQSCHRDLNIFSKYIVSILSKLLDTRDLDLIDLTCSTFIVFCKYHDGSNLGVDAEFTKQYEDLISKFSLFCNYTNTDDTLELQ